MSAEARIPADQKEKSRSLVALRLRLGETTSICPKRHQYVVSCARDDVEMEHRPEGCRYWGGAS